jgi:integration host factor subunit beta
MNKAGLIKELAVIGGVTEKEAYTIVNMIFDGFTKTLKEDGRIELRGFGSFFVRNYDAYTGRNPKTGAKTEVGAKKLPFFKVGKELKERVNG